MYLILLSMAAGILLGHKFYSKKMDFMYLWVVCLLLFFMGLSIGSNRVILENIGSIGLQSLVLAVLGITGSIVFVRFVKL
jgi:uncharacterized membrane protein YbjE (DUF340 family)